MDKMEKILVVALAVGCFYLAYYFDASAITYIIISVIIFFFRESIGALLSEFSKLIMSVAMGVATTAISSYVIYLISEYVLADKQDTFLCIFLMSIFSLLSLCTIGVGYSVYLMAREYLGIPIIETPPSTPTKSGGGPGFSVVVDGVVDVIDFLSLKEKRDKIDEEIRDKQSELSDVNSKLPGFLGIGGTSNAKERAECQKEAYRLEAKIRELESTRDKLDYEISSMEERNSTR